MNAQGFLAARELWNQLPCCQPLPFQFPLFPSSPIATGSCSARVKAFPVLPRPPSYPGVLPMGLLACCGQLARYCLATGALAPPSCC
jgi:hypothetical protein